MIGEAAPFAFAVIAVPWLVHLIGSERFGLLSIIWIAVGYFNLFDLGLGRAITQFAAERIGAGKREQVSSILWSGLAVMLPLGLVTSAALIIWAPTLTDYINIAPPYRLEFDTALRWLAMAIPFVIATTALKGVLQASQQFRTIGLIQLPFGAFMFLGPALAAQAGFEALDQLTLALVIARLVVCALYFRATAKAFPNVILPQASKRQLKSMLQYSGWIAISNLIGPMMVYFDRLVIGAYLTATAVAHYAAPFDAITRTSIFAVSIAAVVFPAVAYLGRGAEERVVSVMNKAQLLVGVCVLPVYAILSAFGGDILKFWINQEFATAGAIPAAILCAGMFANSVARLPHAVLQGRGRADLTAIFHMLELPFYFALLFLLISKYGLIGAAAAWTGRVLLDFILLQFFAGRLLGVDTVFRCARILVICALTVSIAAIGIVDFLPLKIFACATSVVLAIWLLYRNGLMHPSLIKRLI